MPISFLIFPSSFVLFLLMVGVIDHFIHKRRERIRKEFDEVKNIDWKKFIENHNKEDKHD